MVGEKNSTNIVSFNNAHHFITIKLSPSNYLFWRTQVSLFLKGQNLLSYVDGTHKCPHPIIDPRYHLWLQQDALIMSLLVASLSEDVFPKVIGLETSHEIWTSLENAFAAAATPPPVTTQSVQQGDQSVTPMDPGLYESARRGDLDVLRRQNNDQLHIQLTPNGNNLLHVLATFQDSAECTDVILEMQGSTMKQSMLMWKNSKGETALHIAASNGRFKVVGALIEHAKALDQELESGARIAEEMMRMTTDQDGDTALHRAVRNKHANVVKSLVEEDPNFPHPSNRMEETPLYLAVETRNLDIVDSILTACKSVAYGGPGGQNALQAAAALDLSDCIDKLIGKEQRLTKETDEFGCTPLHYAALYGNIVSAAKLLEADRFAAYVKAEKDDNKTPLHVAAFFNEVEVMKEILKHCPDCWEMTTSKGQNVLHLAVDYERKGPIDFILSNSWATYLIKEKDDEGNTPLHLYAVSFDLDAKVLVKHLGANVNAFNKQNLTPLDMIANLKHYKANEDSIKKELQSKGGQRGYRAVIQQGRYNYKNWKELIDKEEKNALTEDIREGGNTQLIVAALIATVTFAAAFTLPGGYDGNEGSPNQGTPILVRKEAFQAFVVSDTIALMSSITAVFLHFLAADESQSRIRNFRLQFRAFLLIIFSSVAMCVAFITGLYVVLAPSSLGLAITICLLGSFTVLSFFWAFFRCTS